MIRELLPFDHKRTEEVFINIASYAYEGRGYCNVDVNYENNVLTLVFTDNGVEFNPLEKEDPNTKQKAEERSIGLLTDAAITEINIIKENARDVPIYKMNRRVFSYPTNSVSERKIKEALGSDSLFEII